MAATVEPLIPTAARAARKMRRFDARGTYLASLAKDWAYYVEHRERMISEPPRGRWWHRFTRHRGDLPRLAAVVHGLCERDGVEVPAWVWQHRSRHDIGWSGQRVNQWHIEFCQSRNAPEACAYHRVWFDGPSIEDIRIHGFTCLAVELPLAL